MAMHSRFIGMTCMVRSSSAGVFFGTVDEKEGQEVRMSNARRVWYWKGAATLSQLAKRGSSCPAECKFPEAVDSVELSEVCEVIPVTKEALASLNSVPVWQA